MNAKEARAMVDWVNTERIEREPSFTVILRALQAQIQTNNRKIKYLEDQNVEIEEEMTAIEDASGIELPLDEPRGIMAYVKDGEGE